MDALETSDGDRIAKLRQLLADTWESNSFYREHWRLSREQIEGIQSLADFRALIPTVEKKHFIADQAAVPPYGKRLAGILSRGERVEIYTTSGTSGLGREVHAQTGRELRNVSEIYRPYFSWAGLERGDSVFLTLPISMLVGGRVEYHAALDYGLTVFPAGNYSVEDKLQLLRTFKPKALYGSTSYFGRLAAAGEPDSGFKTVSVLLTGLEGASVAYFNRLEREWSAKAADRFGCAQMGCDFMFTCERGVGTPDQPGILHNIDSMVILEVLDPQTHEPVSDGEFGEIVVTSLIHPDNPMIRSKLNDGGVYRAPGACACGRALSGLQVGSIGRMDDVKRIKGVNVNPQVVDAVVYRVDGVGDYQVLIRHTADLADVVVLKATLAARAAADARAAVVTRLGRELHQRTGIHFEVEIVAELPGSVYKARRWIDERSR